MAKLTKLDSVANVNNIKKLDSVANVNLNLDQEIRAEEMNGVGSA